MTIRNVAVRTRSRAAHDKRAGTDHLDPPPAPNPRRRGAPGRGQQLQLAAPSRLLAALAAHLSRHAHRRRGGCSPRGAGFVHNSIGYARHPVGRASTICRDVDRGGPARPPPLSAWARSAVHRSVADVRVADVDLARCFVRAQARAGAHQRTHGEAEDQELAVAVGAGARVERAGRRA